MSNRNFNQDNSPERPLAVISKGTKPVCIPFITRSYKANIHIAIDLSTSFLGLLYLPVSEDDRFKTTFHMLKPHLISAIIFRQLIESFQPTDKQTMSLFEKASLKPVIECHQNDPDLDFSQEEIAAIHGAYTEVRTHFGLATQMKVSADCLDILTREGFNNQLSLSNILKYHQHGFLEVDEEQLKFLQTQSESEKKHLELLAQYTGLFEGYIKFHNLDPDVLTQMELPFYHGTIINLLADASDEWQQFCVLFLCSILAYGEVQTNEYAFRANLAAVYLYMQNDLPGDHYIDFVHTFTEYLMSLPQKSNMRFAFFFLLPPDEQPDILNKANTLFVSPPSDNQYIH